MDIKSILNSKTIKQVSITVPATIINGVLGVFFYILAARILGPSGFGNLIIAITFLTLITDIFDLGTNSGLIRFIPRVEEHSKRNRIFKTSLVIKLISGGVVIILGLLIAPWIATVIFRKTELENLLRISTLGVFSALLFTFSTASLQALQYYRKWGFVNIASNLLRLLVVAGFAVLGIGSSENILFIYIFVPLLGFFLGLSFLPWREFVSAKLNYGLFREMWGFNKNVAAFSFVAASSSRLDTFLSARFLSVGQVGIYGAANQLMTVFPQIISAIGVVVAPKFASFDTNLKMLTYLRKFQLLVIALAGGMILLLPLANWIIPFMFGEPYRESIPVFIVLVIAMLVFLISIPVHNAIIYYYGRSDIFVWISIGHLLVILVSGLLLISRFGVVGSGLTVLIGSLFNFIAPLVWFLILLRRTHR